MKILYTAEATAIGGRNGRVKSNNGVLDLQVRTPRAMGGVNDDYTNPEQLFAAGYASCFDSALNLVIKQAKVESGETTVTAKVGVGQIDGGGYGFAIILAVNVPEVSLDQAKELVEKAHRVCPYSNATRGNTDVDLLITNNLKP